MVYRKKEIRLMILLCPLPAICGVFILQSIFIVYISSLLIHIYKHRIPIPQDDFASFHHVHFVALFKMCCSGLVVVMVCLVNAGSFVTSREVTDETVFTGSCYIFDSVFLNFHLCVGF